MNKKAVIWGLWIIFTLAGAAYFINILYFSDDKTVFMPGEVTHGHHQIEMVCEACHSENWSDQDTLQKACVNCHDEELEEAHDSHPKSKFTDPRNADRLEKIDARFCIACHVEHKSEVHTGMGVTLQEDFCFRCHEDIAEDRESHKGLGFETCASSGCHNFHDNKALYEDYLLAHANEPDHKSSDWVSMIKNVHMNKKANQNESKVLDQSGADMPESLNADSDLIEKWAKSAHAYGGINCSECHNTQDSGWKDAVAIEDCESCHKEQATGFKTGKHGMRFAVFKEERDSIQFMSPSLARIPMKVDSFDEELTCNTCHKAHDYLMEEAAVESCIGCHDDQHTNAYKNSKHFELWRQEVSGELEKGAGVSCASCHMPKVFNKDHTEMHTQHNQNHNLRPNEKMIRSVCMNCHGLQFSLNALADQDLILNNFSSASKVHVESIEWATARDK